MMEAVLIRLLFVDDDGSAIMVNISVVITLLNDDGFVVAIPMITVADDVTIAVPVTISVTLTNGYANRADTNPHFFSSSRHCTANSSYGGDHYGILNHCVFLSLLDLWEGNTWTPGSFRLGAQAKGRCISSPPRWCA
jgi:hypothetical protein